jgi:hypothetical protein
MRGRRISYIAFRQVRAFDAGARTTVLTITGRSTKDATNDR